MSTCVTKVGSPFLLYQALPLNSKIGSVHKRTFSRVTIKRVSMMGINKKRLIFC